MFDPSQAFDPNYWRSLYGSAANTLGFGAPPPTPGTTLNSTGGPTGGGYAMPMAPGVTAPHNMAFQDSIQDLQQDAGDAGIPSTMISGDRSIAKQQQLYNLRQAGQWPNPVAYPGSSMHNQGLAADITANDPTQQSSLIAMSREPWRNITPGANFNDPNHFQASGGPISPQQPVPVASGPASAVPRATVPGTSLASSSGTNTPAPTSSPYANAIGALMGVATKPFDDLANVASAGYIPQGTVTNAANSAINSVIPSGGPVIPSAPSGGGMAPASINPMAGLTGALGGLGGNSNFMGGLSKLAGGLGGNKQQAPQAPPPPNMTTNASQIAAQSPALMKQLMQYYRIPEIGGAA